MKSFVINSILIVAILILNGCKPSVSDEEKILRANSVQEISEIISDTKDDQLKTLGNSRIELLQFVDLLRENSSEVLNEYRVTNSSSNYSPLLEYLAEQPNLKEGEYHMSFTDTTILKIFHQVEKIDALSKEYFIKSFENYFSEILKPIAIQPVFVNNGEELNSDEGFAIFLRTKTGTRWHVNEETGQTHNPDVLNMNGSIALIKDSSVLNNYEFDFETGLIFAGVCNVLAKVQYNKGNKYMDDYEMQKFWNFFMNEALGEDNKNKYRSKGNTSFSPNIEDILFSYFSPSAVIIQLLDHNSKSHVKLAAYQELKRKGLQLDASFYENLLSFKDFDFPSLRDEIAKTHPKFEWKEEEK